MSRNATKKHFHILREYKCCSLLQYGGVDSFRDRVPIKKTTQGRLNESQILHLGVTIRLIDRSQGKKK
jgi:hypothetical protein